MNVSMPNGNFNLLDKADFQYVNDEEFNGLYDLNYSFKECFCFDGRWQTLTACEVSQLKLEISKITRESNRQSAKEVLNKEIEILVANKTKMLEWSRVMKVWGAYHSMGNKGKKPSWFERFRLLIVCFINRKGYMYLSGDKAMRTEKFMYSHCAEQATERG